jgi:hypothetical protein
MPRDREIKATSLAVVHAGADVARMTDKVTAARRDGVTAALTIHRSLVLHKAS